MTASWPCGCGQTAHGSPGVHRHPCGIVATVTKNGDVGFNVSFDRSRERPRATLAVDGGEIVRLDAEPGDSK